MQISSWQMYQIIRDSHEICNEYQSRNLNWTQAERRPLQDNYCKKLPVQLSCAEQSFGQICNRHKFCTNYLVIRLLAPLITRLGPWEPERPRKLKRSTDYLSESCVLWRVPGVTKSLVCVKQQVNKLWTGWTWHGQYRVTQEVAPTGFQEDFFKSETWFISAKIKS